MFLFYARKISTKMSLKYVAHWHHHISTYKYVSTDIGSFVIFCRKEFLHTVQKFILPNYNVRPAIAVSEITFS